MDISVKEWSYNGVELKIAAEPLLENKVYTITNRTSDFVRTLGTLGVAEVRELPDTTKVIHAIDDPAIQKLLFQFHRYGPKPEVGSTSTPHCPFQAGENLPRFKALLGEHNLLTNYEGESEKYRKKIISLFQKQAKTLPAKWGEVIQPWIEAQKGAGNAKLFDTIHQLVGECLIKGLLNYDECTKEEVIINTTFWRDLFYQVPTTIEKTPSKSIVSITSDFASGILNNVGKAYTYFWVGSKWAELASTIFTKTVSKSGTLCQTMREEGLSDIEITENVKGLLLAGQETVGYLLGFLLYEYARKPQMQNKHREALTADLEYGRSLVKNTFLETLRMYPVGGAIREAGHDLVLKYRSKTSPETPSYQYIKKGDTLSIYPWASNRYSDIFGQNTHEFDPTRKGLDQVKTTLFPFGKGPHRCPGEKIAEAEILFLAEKILLSTKIFTHEEIEDTIEGFTLRPLRDILVTFSSH